MLKVFMEFAGKEPQYKCNNCFHCKSLFGTSLNSIKNRGCCWYYPKFTLYEIHKMSKSKEGIDTLKKILNNHNTKVYNYYIHTIGGFDKEGYEKFIKTNGKCKLKNATSEEVDFVNQELLIEERDEFYFEEFQEFHIKPLNEKYKPRVIHDKSMFFRTCPFVKENFGCTIKPEFRSYICNLFICDEVIEKIKINDNYENLISERDNYIRWLKWENTSLQIYFEEKRLNLKDNFDEVIKELKNMKIEKYEFKKTNDKKSLEILV